MKGRPGTEDEDTPPRDARTVRTRPTLLQRGELVDHYKVLRRIGRGAMGEVYLARDSKLGRKVALKILKPVALGSDDVVERFLFEARATALFSHPHIVTVYGVGEYHGQPYLALEYLRGDSLRGRIASGQLSTPEVVRTVRAIAEALAEAHRHQILHRDLKPENVMIPRDGRIRVVDFGLAKVVADDRPGADPDALSATATASMAGLVMNFTQDGAVRGTPSYMAPEQWAGGECTGATDVWAVGVMLYELLQGWLPFQAATVHALCVAVCKEDPVAPMEADVPPGLAALVESCLVKDPLRRPDIESVVDTLAEHLGGARTDSTYERPPFRGLLPFDERHAAEFYGRSGEIAAFLERMREEPVLPVIGPSGAGKSSFVLAGVIPRLREQGEWLVLKMRPGRRPLRSLAARLLAPHVSGLRLKTDSQQDSYQAAMPLDTPPDLTGLGADDLDAGELELERELTESPFRLALRLGQIAEQEGVRVLLFVDQLEELYTLVDDVATRRLFMGALCRSADDPQGPVRTVFTAREDFLGRMAEEPEIRDVLGRVTVLRSPGPEALAEILEAPVASAGYSYDDPALVDEMVDAVRGEPAALPLLQFTCQMLWKARDRGNSLLQRSSYEAIGGVAGALAHHADDVLRGLSTRQMALARDLLLRLVALERPKRGGSATPVTRQVVDRTDLLDGLHEDAQQVLDRLVQGRLLLVHKARVDHETGEGPEARDAEFELVHESLVHSWDRLARWITEGREKEVFRSEVLQAAQLWERRGRRQEELWRGDALGDGLRWAGRSSSVPSLARRFLDASQARQQGRARRRRTLLAIGFGAVVLVAVVLALQARVANQQRDLAESRHHTAEQKRAEALLEGARMAALTDEMLEARSKARETLELHDTPAARALWRGLSRDPRIWKAELKDQPHAVRWSPDGSQLAVGGEDRPIRLYDARSGTLLRALRGHGATVASLAYSPDGRMLASGAYDDTVRLWDVQSGEQLAELLGHDDAITGVDFSPDGRSLATGSFDGSVRIWDVSTGAVRQILSAGPVTDVAFDPTGRLVAVSNPSGTARLLDIEDTGPHRTLEGHTSGVIDVDFSPDGDWLATAGRDSTVRIWDVRTGQASHVLEMAGHAFLSVAFSPSGERVAAAGVGPGVHLWDTATAEHRHQLHGHSALVTEVAFGPTDDVLASASFDQTVRIWAVDAAATTQETPRHTSAVWSTQFSPDGQKVLSTGAEAILWDRTTGEPLWDTSSDSAETFRFSPDGRLLARMNPLGTIQLLEPTTLGVVRVLTGPPHPVDGPLFTADGEVIGVGAGQRFVTWDVDTGQLEGSREMFPDRLERLAFVPGGSKIVALLTDGRLGLWNWRTGRHERWLATDQGAPFGFAVSPDGQWLVVGGNDRRLHLWDLVSGSDRVLWERVDLAPSPGMFHPDSRTYGFGASDGNAYVVDLDGTVAEIRVGARDETTSVAFHPDGDGMAISSEDGALRLFAAETGHPTWRAPAMLHEPAEVYTHRGWYRMGEALQPFTPADAAWRRAVEEGARYATQSPDGTRLYLLTHEGQLEAWELEADRLIWRDTRHGLDQVVATDHGCLTLDRDGQVHHVDRAGAAVSLYGGVAAIGWDGATLAAGEGRVVVGDALHGEHTTHAASPDVTAVHRVGGLLVLGYLDGTVEILDVVGSGTAPTVRFQDQPASAVLQILNGPQDTLILGHASGFAGVWSLDSGALLAGTQLSGPVAHMILREDRLFAASEVGDLDVVDLSILSRDYCDLLQEVWREVPTAWVSGAAATRAPPQEHECLR